MLEMSMVADQFKHNLLDQRPFDSYLGDGGVLQYPYTMIREPSGSCQLVDEDTPYGVKSVFRIAATGNAPFTDERENAFIGGWATHQFDIDPSVQYRQSCWVKFDPEYTDPLNRIFFGGTLYPANDVNRLVTLPPGNVVQSNPYFGILSDADTPLGEWLLMVGFVHPHDTTLTANQGAVYRQDGTVVKTLLDFHFQAGATKLAHRMYSYYGNVRGPVRTFFRPRIDEMNSLAPSIQDILNYDMP